MYGRAPCHIYLSAHPALQIKKRTSKATFASCGPKRHKEEGAPDVRVFQVRQIGLKEEGIDLEVVPDD